ncbi:hypothetical protein AB0G02_36915, partial [Actinosynnema sp. NPDC023658]|uniref:hypothetical protein n=1 Tax=Actinosynnema sp. NPDC023658 TaxID=3155465 RepID=UPI0033FC9DDE
MSRGIVTAIAATAFGLALVVWGWVLQGRDYVPALLLEIGASVGLAVPLIALNRMTEKRVRRTEEHLADVRERVRETQDRLDDLGEVTRDSLLDRHRRRESLLQQALRTPTPDRLAVLLRELASINATDADGVRTRLPGTTRWLRFTTTGDEGGLRVVEERRDGTEVAAARWSRGERVHLVASALKCDDDRFEAGCRAVVKTLMTALAARVGEAGLNLGPVIEVPNEQWAICSDGLRCTQRYVHLTVDQLLDSHQDWRSHTLGKPWVDREMFLDAYQIASELLATRRRSK